MCKNVILFKDIKYLADCCTYERISTISCTMVSRHQRRCCCFFTKNESSNRNTAPKCFGARHHVWLYTIRLPCKIISSSSHAALNLIKDQNNVLFVAKCAKTLQEFLLSRINSSFTLYDFCNDCTGFICNLCLHTLQIIEVCKLHTADQWFKWLSVMFCSCYRKSSHASAMEGMIHRDNLKSSCFFAIFGIRIFTCSLESALNCLCTTVCKECFTESTGFDQFLSRLTHWFIVIEV